MAHPPPRGSQDMSEKLNENNKRPFQFDLLTLIVATVSVSFFSYLIVLVWTEKTSVSQMTTLMMSFCLVFSIVCHLLESRKSKQPIEADPSEDKTPPNHSSPP
jgi:hypothetical protein